MEPPRLTLLPLLSDWDTSNQKLSLNVMTIPIGDPRQPLNSTIASVPDAPSFVGANIALAAHISTDSLTVPTLADVPPEGTSLPIAAPPGQEAIFEELAAQFDIAEVQEDFERETAFRLAKYLPRSYRERFSFVAPKTDLASIDDSYLCALRCPPETTMPDDPPTTGVSWGEVFAMLVRHPAMARAAGLLHTVSIDFGGAFPGGWVFFSLENGSPFHAQAVADPNYLRVFATRVPVLDEARSVFTAVSFPVAADASVQADLGPLDEVFDEAITFDDGFAKIVHARQPDTADLAADDGSGLPLVTDPGIQLGWDDEDILISTNRGIGDNPDGSMPADAPSAVAGYRVDVRSLGDNNWSSLCKIEGEGGIIGGVDLGLLDGELNVEVHPIKLNQQFWMPAYYTRWSGGSLVAKSAEMQRLSGEPTDTDPISYEAVDAEAVSLRYGQTYEFRVRLADVAGGGPKESTDATNPAVAPIAALEMRRKIPFRPVLVGDLNRDERGPVSVNINRPKLNYPAAVYTGHPQARATLNAIADANEVALAADRKPLTIPDPDASLLRVDVFVEMPGFDASGGIEGFKRLYSTYRAFPELSDLSNETPLLLEFDWVTASRLSDRDWPDASMPVAGSGPISLPTARNTRIEVRAVGRFDLHYFANETAIVGDSAPIWDGSVRVRAVESEPLFGDTDPSTALVSVFLQPDPVPNAESASSPSQMRPSPMLVNRLASALELMHDNGALYAAPGRRLVFSCNGIGHALPPDASSLAITSTSELSQTWISAIRVPIARDWSWIGLATPGITIKRTVQLQGEDAGDAIDLSKFHVPHSVSLQASKGEPDRDSFELLILDAFKPPLDENGFPQEAIVSYTLRALPEAGGEPRVFSVSTRLPVASPPRNAPRLVSAGHALSSYARTPDYAESSERSRSLWFEFENDPRADPRDILFCRIVALSPDPMLLPAYEPDADPPILADLDIDPELIRIVRPGQAEDFAGLSAMMPLIPASDSDHHFAMPLPSSLSAGSPELFGMFTVEFRFGHPKSTVDQPFWSTAQGRFGPPLLIEGVQYPAPPLQLSIRRDDETYLMSADYAQPVRQGRRIPLSRPNTQIWFLLYARVMQADGNSRRNVILLRQLASAQPERQPGLAPRKGLCKCSINDVNIALRTMGLPFDTPLSCLAIELLPEPNGMFADPLGADLGEVRILRTSRLVEVPQECCVK